MKPRRFSRSKVRRGYTVVELLMALAIFGVGITGVVALQKVTGASNQHARNLATATHIAQSWLEMLAMDAASWSQHQTETLQLNTRWLHQVTNSTDWFQPETVDEVRFGPRFGALGQPLLDADAGQTVFCTHLRLTLLINPMGGLNAGIPVTPNNGLIRAEVRVFWPRHAGSTNADYCDGSDVENIGEQIENYHFVYQATVVRQTSF